MLDKIWGTSVSGIDQLDILIINVPSLLISSICLLDIERAPGAGLSPSAALDLLSHPGSLSVALSQ